MKIYCLNCSGYNYKLYLSYPIDFPMKKVLIVTYYWPPAGGPGVQRVLKFAKYLSEFDWKPYILTVKDGEYPAVDKSLENDIPKNCFVYKSKSLEPFKLYKTFVGKKKGDEIPTYILNKSKSDSLKDKIAKWVRLNLFIPDAKIGWIPFAVSNGLKIINENKIDLIFSSSPPQTVNMVAKKLSNKSGVPWVADFRDPWTDAFWQEGGNNRNYFSHKIDKILEKSCLSKAQAITTVSSSLIKLFEKKSHNNYLLLPNGFDSDDFDSVQKTSSNKFRINYIGFLGKDQKIDNFLIAINSVDKKIKNKLDINFYGKIHQTILEKIDSFQLKKIIKINYYIPHNEAIQIMKNSEILLLVIPDVKNNELIVTGKLFEYLAAHNYILGIGPAESDIVQILQETNCGEMFGYEDDLKTVLLEQIQRWEQGVDISVKAKFIQQYSRKELSGKLAELLNTVSNRQ